MVLAFDRALHALELARVGVAPSLAAELWVFFGMRLFERNAHVFGRLHQQTLT